MDPHSILVVALRWVIGSIPIHLSGNLGADCSAEFKPSFTMFIYVDTKVRTWTD